MRKLFVAILVAVSLLVSAAPGVAADWEKSSITTVTFGDWDHGDGVGAVLPSVSFTNLGTCPAGTGHRGQLQVNVKPNPTVGADPQAGAVVQFKNRSATTGSVLNESKFKNNTKTVVLNAGWTNLAVVWWGLNTETFFAGLIDFTDSATGIQFWSDPFTEVRVRVRVDRDCSPIPS